MCAGALGQQAPDRAAHPYRAQLGDMITDRFEPGHAPARPAVS